MSTVNEILKVGVSLESIGVKNWALSKEDAVKALDTFYELQIPILGGDVCESINEVIQYNYDNWYCDRQPNESQLDFVNRSITKARDYINNYNSDNIENIFFAFVPDE
ncbi:Imm40 family immunity protein [Aquiflexum sp. LQ15W]|uniref:Imm40 family immunity protein n=1 Tax=Cognataquiflexum nitidum TaxID=2922272 RepID=UPI001F148080|nr:Imm40 family immunity protein [Cognataquiflexum nitidum]MCH6199871.1 Imm40 family immunity protein [Cognataquiflexum nitidum]